MGKQSFIELKFPIKEIIPQSDLGLKFKQLGMSPAYQRLIIDLELLNEDKKSILTLDIILDTGALLSLLPITFLKYYPDLNTVGHTIWGIVDSPECQIRAEIGRIWIRINDLKGNKSPPIQIPVAFVDLDTSPHLLGLKGVLDKAEIRINSFQKTFSLIF